MDFPHLFSFTPGYHEREFWRSFTPRGLQIEDSMSEKADCVMIDRRIIGMIRDGKLSCLPYFSIFHHMFTTCPPYFNIFHHMTEPRKLRQTSELMTMMGLTGAVVWEGFAVGGPVADAMASASVSRPIDLLRISKTFQTVFKIHRYPASFHVDRWFFPNIFQQTSHSQNSLAVTCQCPP